MCAYSEHMDNLKSPFINQESQGSWTNTHTHTPFLGPLYLESMSCYMEASFVVDQPVSQR